jgi:hypothetical protein
MDKFEKAKYYAGLVLLLEEYKLLSINMGDEFQKNIKSDANFSESQMKDIMTQAKEQISLASSCIYIDWKSDITDKATTYAGLILVMEDHNLLSMNLNFQFQKNIMRDCHLNDTQMKKVMLNAKKNIHFDSSSIYVDWK